MITFPSVNDMRPQLDEIPAWPRWAPCQQSSWTGDGRQEQVCQLDGIIYLVAIQYQPDMQNGRREIRVYSDPGSGLRFRRQGETPDMMALIHEIMTRLPSYAVEWVL